MVGSSRLLYFILSLMEGQSHGAQNGREVNGQTGIADIGAQVPKSNKPRPVVNQSK